MSHKQDGPALILVFANGILEQALVHLYDGGEAYMAPFLRRGISYAKTHYDCGNIVDVLRSEVETRKVCDDMLLDTARRMEVRHVYYLTYRWDQDAGRKVYHLYALHLTAPAFAGKYELPFVQRDIPGDAVRIL